ncbi:putative Receptor protein kinase TMK1 [Cocos nucifera]|uniref:Putative Receptor protein kinase TMK1 n=1 Tax=Cocos nucifera TaxID=13894 RepID=A0A8K0MY86_COCNU|nr:putative Receptor protein kinase TMK1 [Cocos nucifera]
MGRITTKADIFSFGVILMELITGRKAIDTTQSEESRHLATWFRRMHLNKDAFQKAIDPNIILDEETFKSIKIVADLACHCTMREPHQRPDMAYAVNVLSSLAEIWKPTDVDSDDDYGIDLETPLAEVLKKWQEYAESSQMDEPISLPYIPNFENSQSSIATRPRGFAETFTSANAR